MKVNWGYAVLIFFIFYISLLVLAVFKSLSVDHSLVADNYYQHDITYQKKYDAIANRKLLRSDLNISYNSHNKELLLSFGSENVDVKGTIVFYRASSKRDDFTEEFVLQNNNQYVLETHRLKTGRWTVKVEWKDQSRTYYKEEDIYISRV